MPSIVGSSFLIIGYDTLATFYSVLGLPNLAFSICFFINDDISFQNSLIVSCDHMLILREFAKDISVVFACILFILC
jgi:hypothetical protein